MPNLEEQFAQLAGKRYFTSLDLRIGYNQIKMEESSKEYTAFVTMQGHYEYNKMPFGLVNAPATFQRVMNVVIAEMNPGEVLAYLDDAIIPSKTIEEGFQRLEKFLSKLKDAGLILHLNKCEFMKREISYLGHKVSENGITPAAIAKAKQNKEMIPKLARWWMRMLDYDCEIVHRQGSHMCHVHALSRAPDKTPPELDEDDRIMSLNVAVEDWLLTMQIQDPDLLNIVAVLKDQKYSPQKTQLKQVYIW